uniref:Uncharacterized protein n=1 Tax=Avena sativa TaxID=4498 RepID=A0ACD5ZTM1_AVESA
MGARVVSLVCLFNRILSILQIWFSSLRRNFGLWTIMWRKTREAEERKYFMRCIELMEEDLEEDGTFTKELPRPKIVKHHDLLGKLWGWERLLPRGASVNWSQYSTYLEEYHRQNADAVSSIDALAQTCLDSEEQLVFEYKIQTKSESLTVRKLIVLSCLIHQRVRSSIRTGCSFSHVSGAALLCIAKEADLTCQLLRLGADLVDDYLIGQGREIRACALALMNCTPDSSVASAAVMLGMAKEAEILCAWMSKTNEPVDFDEDDPIPDEILNCHRIRHRTMDIMVKILEESSPAANAAASLNVDKEGPASRNGPGGDRDGITADGAANTTGGGISDVLDSHHKEKTAGGDKRKLEKEDLLEKLWGLLLVLANQNPEDSQFANSSYIGAALAKSCLKMEEELLSEWKTRVERTLPVSTIIQSALIKELALSKTCSAGGELSAPSDVAFVCIANEAELMCELLKQGAKPFDDMIKQSSVIRVCALGLANLRGHRSIAPAAAMLGLAKEAKKMCDWIKREKKLGTFSLCEPHDLEECRLIRIKALDVMTRILDHSSFPCPKMRDDDATACD